jgi:hypothetical protein
LEILLGKLLGTPHVIRYENNASQRKFFILGLDIFFLMKRLHSSTAQYTNPHPFSMLLTGQLLEVL